MTPTQGHPHHYAEDEGINIGLDAITFDRKSGSMLERLIFINRPVIVVVCLILSVFFAWRATDVELNASFDRMIPLGHPYIQNMLDHRGDLGDQGNTLKVVVENRKGSIIDYDYLMTLQRINDELILFPGVARHAQRSLWTSATRWVAVTEDGLEGGPVMPAVVENTPESLAEVRSNIDRASVLGQMVAIDYQSSAIIVPLMGTDAETGKPLDYGALSRQLEDLRARYSSDDISIRITGFAKIVGDLIGVLPKLLMFFGISIVIAAAFVYWYTRCSRSTALVVICSLVAVVWQMGLLPIIGFSLDPYSILVPFLIFAIGMSHGAQKMNGVMQDIGRGAHKLVAARLTFRRLFLAGFTALVCDAVGFAVLMLIDIDAIRQLALIASIGVAILIFTNLILLPVLLSYTNVSLVAARRSLRAENNSLRGGEKPLLWRFFIFFSKPAGATFAVVTAIVLAGAGYWVSLDLKIGDLDPGAPELRADSIYNQDNAYLEARYGASSDILIVMAETPAGSCTQHGTLRVVDALQARLEQVPGVKSTFSFVDLVRALVSGLMEENLKWFELINNQATLNLLPSQVLQTSTMNLSCSLLTVSVSLADHKAETLARVVQAVEAFAAVNDSDAIRFKLAGGNAGIEAATNIVLEQANREMLIWVYAAVTVLCFITFRSWRAVVCAVLPLVLTTILAEALMVALGIGVKVATLPVVALGVGIGVDYALYVLSIVLVQMRDGQSLTEAYYRSLLFTGRVVLLTGFTLAIGVATWAFSPIKFQADMGILLAFMFLWNMVGALGLMPALAYFLLPRSGEEEVAVAATAAARH